MIASRGNKVSLPSMVQKKGKNNSLLMKELGVYCLDISKLIFGGVVLAGIMDLEINRYWLFGLGSLIVIVIALAGFAFIKLSDVKNR